MKLCKTEKTAICLSIALAVIFASPVSANAMHIMEGYLPLGHSVAWGAACIPFIASGGIRLRRTFRENRRALVLLAMSGAFIFVMSSLKIPSVTGSSSHMTGTGLAAILFGVPVTCILAIIILIFQAVLLAHGGLTTLGANTFGMGVAGPMITVILYKICRKFKLKQSLNIFIPTALGCLFTYCFTAFQLALAYPGETGGVAASLVKFLGVFAPTQIPLAVVEGILTVLVLIGMESYAKRELASVSYMGCCSHDTGFHGANSDRDAG